MNRIFKPLAMTATALLLSGAMPAAADAPAGHNGFKSSTGIFDIDALEALGRVSSPQVSPDGQNVLFGISYEDLQQNNSNNDLYLVSLKGNKKLTRLTDTPKSENGAVWYAGGTRIAFMYPGEDGTMQMWTMAADGSDRIQASNHPGGIGGFLLSPDETKIFPQRSRHLS